MAKTVFKLLEDVQSANSFYEVDEFELISGNPTTLYFRLITVRNKDLEDQISDLRYLPAVGATMTVEFVHIDSNKSISRVATQAFPSDDRSVWKVDILATDKIAFNSMKVILTEGSVSKTIFPASKLSSSSSDGSGKYYC